MRKALRAAIAISLAVLVVGAAFGYALYRAAQSVPHFYTEEMAVTPQIQESDSDRMVQQATSLHEDFHRRGPWRQTIQAKTVNAWLAVDLPKKLPDLLPQGARDPRVHIGPEGITLACRVDRGWLHGIVSLQVSAFVESADVVGLRVHRARLGSVPLSVKPVLDAIADAARHSGIRIQWGQVSGDPVALLTITPANGDHKQIVHIDTIRLEEGQLLMAGTTEIKK
jgi:hypothetical protein